MVTKVNDYSYHNNVFTYEHSEDAHITLSVWRHDHVDPERSVRIASYDLTLPRSAMQDLALEILATLEDFD